MPSLKIPPTGPEPSKKQKSVLKAAGGDEPRKRLNVEIPISLHKELKIRAVQDDEQITEIVERLIREYLRS